MNRARFVEFDFCWCECVQIKWPTESEAKKKNNTSEKGTTEKQNLYAIDNFIFQLTCGSHSILMSCTNTCNQLVDHSFSLSLSFVPPFNGYSMENFVLDEIVFLCRYFSFG